jgi:hypothetical protein
LIGLGVGALATYWGKTDNDSLAHCAPNCDAGSLNHISRLYVTADISFGIGAAALGVSTFLFATFHSKEAPPPPRGAQSASFSWDVQPTSTGAVATFQGRF